MVGAAKSPTNNWVFGMTVVIIQVAKYIPNSQNTVYLNADNLLLNHLGEAPEPEAPKVKGWFW